MEYSEHGNHANAQLSGKIYKIKYGLRGVLKGCDSTGLNDVNWTERYETQI